MLLRGLSLVAETKLLYYSAITPDDYWDKSAKIPSAFDSKGRVAKVNFKNKYPGNHVIVLEPDKRIYDTDRFDKLDVDFAVEIFDGGELIAKYEVNKTNLRRYTTNSFRVGYYVVPYDMPYGKQLTCEVAIKTPDKFFQDNYGPFSVYIKKISDM